MAQMTGGMKPSRYQQAVFDFVATGSGNAVVEAVAGSGKTTTILQSLALIPADKRVVFLAFNRDIAQVLADRTREMGVTNAECMTLNALGNRAWNRFRGQTRGKVESTKTKAIAKAYRETLEKRYSETLAPAHEAEWRCLDTHFSGIVSLVAKAKVAGMVPQGVPGVTGLVADTDEAWADLIAHYSIEFDEEHQQDAAAIRIARAILRKSVLNTEVIDFDDQFYMPLIYGATFDRPDFLFIDEAQDVSDIQREILRRCMHATTRLIAVGDPHQSIYGFRGANPNSLALIAEDFQATRLPLSISYRCSKAVVARAQEIVSHIEASATAAEGRVADLGEKFAFADFRPQDMVLCRNTAPLISLAYSLIANRIPCVVKGRDIGSGLIKLIEKLDAATVAGLETKLLAWEAKECRRLTKKDADADCSSVTDKADSIRAFIARSQSTRVADLLAEIRAMFRLAADDSQNTNDAVNENALVLSTVHKSKGLEADRVFILNAFLMPSKYAKTEWALAQETNLQYVAVTRAKKELFFIEVAKEGASQEQMTGAVSAAAAVQTTNAHVGEVGGRFAGRVQVTEATDRTGDFGPYTLVKMLDEQGRLLTWFAAKGLPVGVQAGSWVVVEGQVKSHKEFKGTKETQLTRCTVR